MRVSRSGVLAVSAFVLLGACSAPAAEGPTGESEAAAPTAPSSAPTPSPDPAAAFAAWLDDSGGSLSARLAGTKQRGSDPIEQIDGTYRAVRDESAAVFHTLVPTGIEPTEHRYVDGQCYVRTGGLGWHAEEMGAMTGSLYTSLSDATWAGLPGTPSTLTSADLDLVALAANLGLLPVVVSIGDRQDEVVGEVALTVATDGRLLGMVADLNHTLTILGAQFLTTWSLTYEFDDSSAAPSISAPRDVSRMHVSAYGYVWDLPADWTFQPASEADTWDVYRSPAGVMAVTRGSGAAGHDPDEVLGAWEAEITAQADSISSVTPTSVGGAPARYLVGTAHEEGTSLFMQAFVIVVGDSWYVVQWYSSPGEEGPQSVAFIDLVSRLSFTP